MFYVCWFENVEEKKSRGANTYNNQHKGIQQNPNRCAHTKYTHTHQHIFYVFASRTCVLSLAAEFLSKYTHMHTLQQHTFTKKNSKAPSTHTPPPYTIYYRIERLYESVCTFVRYIQKKPIQI